MAELWIGLCGGIGAALVNGAVQLLLRRRSRADTLTDRRDALSARLTLLEEKVERLLCAVHALSERDERRAEELRRALSDLRESSICSLGDILRGIYHRYAQSGAIEAMYEELSRWEVRFE